MASNKFTLILDSTQLANYFACPAMWYLGDRRLLIRSDIQVKDDAKDDSALDMGTYFHKMAELYYRTYRFQYDASNALEYALTVDMDKTHCECKHSIEHHSCETTPGACSIASCMCGQFTPRPFPLGAIKRSAVKDRFREYVYVWNAKGDFDVPSPDYVEVGFSECLYEDSERIFIIEGRMDIARCNYNGTECVVDHKLQVRRKDHYLKRIQYRNYSMVAHLPFLIVNYIRMAKEASSETFKRSIASFTMPEQIHWRKQLIKTYHDISNYLMYGENDHLPPQNWGNCETGNGYYACQFTPLCEETYLGKEMMQNRIEQLYQIRPQWTPW